MGTRTPNKDISVVGCWQVFSLPRSLSVWRCQELVSVSCGFAVLFLSGSGSKPASNTPFPAAYLQLLCSLRHESVLRCAILCGHNDTSVCSVALSSLRRYGSHC